MIKCLLFVCSLFFCFSLYPQELTRGNSKNVTAQEGKLSKPPIAKIEQYLKYSLENDTIQIDTSLTIHKEYAFNYLRRDLFGLLPFANEGQPYIRLKFKKNNYSPIPSVGVSAKHFNFYEHSDIMYYHVPTPFSELFYRSVMEQGQNVDAIAAVNTSFNTNFSVGYKGLRSLGKYLNSLASTGNFQLTLSHTSKDNRYNVRAHFTSQDLYNGEHGGIVFPVHFISGNSEFTSRNRLQVFSEDANSMLKGQRYFFDHSYKLSKTKDEFGLALWHQFNYEYKFYEYNQNSVATNSIIDGSTQTFYRYGQSFGASAVKDKSRFYQLSNYIGPMLVLKDIGSLKSYVHFSNVNQKYNRIYISNDSQIPDSNQNTYLHVGGELESNFSNYYTKIKVIQGLSEISPSMYQLTAAYQKDRVSVTAELGFQETLPSMTNSFFQSQFQNYNWTLELPLQQEMFVGGELSTPWGILKASYRNIDHLTYFQNMAIDGFQMLAKPTSHNEAIQYFSIEASKEFKLGKFSLDNRVLYQNVQQSEALLNVPSFVNRHTLYYTDKFFNKKLFIQTGVTMNYFSAYFADDYNPVIGDFVVQNNHKIGDFPMFDLFVNARIQQTRIYLKAEHFNSSFSGYNYFNTPSYPYRDFTFRIGIEWNFFQ